MSRFTRRINAMDTPDINTPRSTSGRRHRRRGFTLVELVVVLVIVSILAVIAIPSFIGQLRKSRRGEAVTEIYRVSQAQERFRASSPAYSNDFGTPGLRLFTAANQLSYTTADGYYTLSVTVANATRYVVVATAAGGMSGDTNCSTLRMDVDGGLITYESLASNVLNTPQANRTCWNR
jgi:type IV pilus assembly protein PilE